jgi:hypothetical protein
MLLKTLGWLLGIFTIFLTGMYFDQGDTLSGIISMFAIGVFIPPILNKINENAQKKAQEKQKSTKPTSLKSGVIIGLVLLFFSYLATNTDSVSHNSKVISNANTVFSVSDFDYTMNNEKAVAISFGESQTNYCTVTMYRNLVANGYSAISEQSNAREISMDCHWDSQYYVESSKHPTLAKINIKELDQQAKRAQIIVSLNLVNPSKNTYLTLENVTLNLLKDQTNSLIK